MFCYKPLLFNNMFHGMPAIRLYVGRGGVISRVNIKYHAYRLITSLYCVAITIAFSLLGIH